MSADGAVFRHAPDNCLPLGRAALRKATLPPSDIDDAKASLERVVDNDIGPRLVLFHHEPIAPCPPEGRPTQADVERLALLVIGQDEAVAVAHFEEVRAQQHAYSTLLSYFIAPAAELLGEYWRQDVCNFFDVTIGVGRLQSFMDRMAAPEPVSTGDVARRALLIALPGETHLLGIRIVARVLESTGWDVTVEEHLTAEDNAKTVAREWIGVVGISMSNASRAELAARTVSAVRSASLNPHVGIMAGGNALVQRPELAFQIGADAVGYDAPTAVVVASHLLMRQAAKR